MADEKTAEPVTLDKPDSTVKVENSPETGTPGRLEKTDQDQSTKQANTDSPEGKDKSPDAAPKAKRSSGSKSGSKAEHTATDSDDPEKLQQILDRKNALAEREEREGYVEYDAATYKAPDATDLYGVAAAVGLNHDHLAELVRLNDRPVTALVEKGEEIRLPRGYSYDGIKGVSGGAVRK